MSFVSGENVVAFWEDKVFEWYLWVVDSVDNEGIPLVSYMARSIINGSEWVFPETAEILKTIIDVLCESDIP